jgi:hypothetical protein
LWYFDRQGHQWFPYLAGALLGCSGGLLWAAAGFIQFAYAQEDEKSLVRLIGTQVQLVLTD